GAWRRPGPCGRGPPSDARLRRNRGTHRPCRSAPGGARAPGIMTLRPANEAPVRVPGAIADGIFDQARADPGNEICGFVAARGGEPVRLHPVPNIAPDRRDRYRMDPAVMVRTLFEIDAAGEALF